MPPKKQKKTRASTRKSLGKKATAKVKKRIDKKRGRKRKRVESTLKKANKRARKTIRRVPKKASQSRAMRAYNRAARTVLHARKKVSKLLTRGGKPLKYRGRKVHQGEKGGFYTLSGGNKRYIAPAVILGLTGIGSGLAYLAKENKRKRESDLVVLEDDYDEYGDDIWDDDDYGDEYGPIISGALEQKKEVDPPLLFGDNPSEYVNIDLDA